MNRHGIKEPCIFSELMHNEKHPAAERTFNRLKDDALFLMVAGTDAPSQALAIMLYHILNNREVHEKLREELVYALPDARSDPSLAVLENIPYLVSQSRFHLVFGGTENFSHKRV